MLKKKNTPHVPFVLHLSYEACTKNSLTASKFITVVSTVIVIVAHTGGINTPPMFA